MSFQDKSIKCSDCGIDFTHSAEDQEFERNGNDGYGSQRQMHSVVCADCGKDTEVPFEPRGDKPVYCSDCYRKVRTSS